MILISILASLPLVIHDVMVLSNALPDQNFLHFRIVYILIVPALSIMFIHRLVLSLNQVDDLAETLEDRISSAEASLRKSYEEQQALARQKALSDERQRIMRDVHDGLGGQLVSIIAMSRMDEANTQKIERSAEAALGDLRLVIGSLSVENDITGMLGTVRERAEQQLAVHNVELGWRMIDIAEIDGLNPSRALNILRIMQEATTNALKHAAADKLTISFAMEQDAAESLRIDIRDNGTGLGSKAATGHGLENMRKRAEDLGGKLEICDAHPGCRVALWVPTKTA